MDYLNNEGFNAGWTEAQRYNDETSRLYAEGPSMNH
jgi:hypothetical protein